MRLSPDCEILDGTDFMSIRLGHLEKDGKYSESCGHKIRRILFASL